MPLIAESILVYLIKNQVNVKFLFGYFLDNRDRKVHMVVRSKVTMASFIMKQEPPHLSKDLSSVLSDIPQQLSVFSGKTGDRGIVGSGFVAVFLNLLFLAVMFVCLNIKKSRVPLYSSIQVEYQESMRPISNLSLLSEEPMEVHSISVPLPEKMDGSMTVPKMEPLRKFVAVDHHSARGQGGQENDAASSHPAVQASPVGHGHEQGGNRRQQGKEVSSAMVDHVFPDHRCTSPDQLYPLAARKRHEQGIAKIALRILPNGQVEQVHLVEPSGFSDLDQAAVKAVQSIKCKKADAEDHDVQTVIPVVFSLNRK